MDNSINQINNDANINRSWIGRDYVAVILITVFLILANSFSLGSIGLWVFGIIDVGIINVINKFVSCTGFGFECTIISGNILFLILTPITYLFFRLYPLNDKSDLKNDEKIKNRKKLKILTIIIIWGISMILGAKYF